MQEIKDLLFELSIIKWAIGVSCGFIIIAFGAFKLYISSIRKSLADVGTIRDKKIDSDIYGTQKEIDDLWIITRKNENNITELKAELKGEIKRIDQRCDLICDERGGK